MDPEEVDELKNMGVVLFEASIPPIYVIKAMERPEEMDREARGIIDQGAQNEEGAPIEGAVIEQDTKIEEKGLHRPIGIINRRGLHDEPEKINEHGHDDIAYEDCEKEMDTCPYHIRIREESDGEADEIYSENVKKSGRPFVHGFSPWCWFDV